MEPACICFLYHEVSRRRGFARTSLRFEFQLVHWLARQHRKASSRSTNHGVPAYPTDPVGPKEALFRHERDSLESVEVLSSASYSIYPGCWQDIEGSPSPDNDKMNE